MTDRNTRQSEQEYTRIYVRIKEEKHIKYLDKKESIV
jgi:hypothetical protein